MPFRQLRLIEPLLRALQGEGYELPTAIQKEAIPHVLEGRDLLGCAQTGTGKTAAFALPILQRLHTYASNAGSVSHHHVAHASQHAAGGQVARRPIRSLIVTPTRELAAQIGESFAAYGRHTNLRHTVVFGGVGQGPQVHALKRGVDILVATPGRLLDLLGQRQLSLAGIEILVLDEADRMLDMGFIHDIRRIIALLPTRRQTLLFSATMPREIRSLAAALLQRPIEVSIPSESPAADTVEQSLYHVETNVKPALLAHLLEGPEVTRALVFVRTKHGADKVVKRLMQAGNTALAIHANKSQNARLRALESFKKGQTRVLVASDIAARGLDVDAISHVINYDLPNVPETYVHRIGRTGRAGAQGKAISFCSSDQRDLLADIERLLGRRLPVLRPTIKLVAEQRLPAIGGAEPSPHGPHGGHGRPSHAQHGRPAHGQHGAHGHKQSQVSQDDQAAAGQVQGELPQGEQAAGQHGQHAARSHRGPRRSSPQQQKNNFWLSRRKPRRGGRRPFGR